MFKTSKVKEEYVKLFENVTNEQFNHISIKDPRVRHSKHVQTVSVEGSKLGKLTPVDAALYNFSLHAVMQGCVLTAKEKKILKIEKIGIYVKDVFNFSGEQYLGFWKEPDTVARWGILGYNVSNKHFREYRKRNHVGKDFFVFSDVEVVTFPKVLEVKF